MRKKLFAILMSAMMMVTFMPAMAFAVVSDNEANCTLQYTLNDENYIQGTTWEQIVKDSEAKETKDYVEVVQAPTHEKDGIVKLYCKKNFCDEVVKAYFGKTVCNFATEKELTVKAFADAMVAQKELGWNQYKAAKWVADCAQDWCYVNAHICSCGKVEFIGQPGMLAAADFGRHTGMQYACADYTCARCGLTIKGTGVHTPKTAVDTSKTPDFPKTCGYNGYNATCACGASFVWYNNVDTEGTAAHTWKNIATKAEATKLVRVNATTNKRVLNEGFLALDSNGSIADVTEGVSDQIAYTFVKYDKVESGSACTGNATVSWNCAVCGATLKNDSITNPQHDYEVTHVAATCDHAGYEYKVCKVCGDEVNTDGASTIATEPALGHTYVVKHVEATCDKDEYYEITCSTCDYTKATCTAHKAKIERNAIVGVSDNTKGGEAVFVGFDGDTLTGSKVIVLTFAAQTNSAHKYGAKELLKAATCTTDEVWGYKCTVCGKIATHADTTGHNPETKANTKLGHDFVKTVKVTATCGKAGLYNYVCSVCDAVKKTTVEGVEVEVTETIAPVVKAGTACVFDTWKTVKAATVFETGAKVLSCATCGATSEHFVEIAKKSYAAPKVSVKKGKVVVTVAAQEGAVKYVVKAGKKTKTVTAAGKVTLKKVAKKGKKVKVTVTAYNAAGAKVVSKAKTVKAK